MNIFCFTQRIARATALTLFISLFGLTSSQAEQFIIAVVPDTQAYLDHNGDSVTNGNAQIFFAQTQWLANNLNTLDRDTNGEVEEIIYITHTGDIVNQGDCNPHNNHWATANDAYTTLDNAGATYGILPGNHDYDFTPGNGCEPDEPTLKYNDGVLSRPGFGADRYSTMTEYGPQAQQYDTAVSSADNDNNFLLFQSPGGVQFIGINLAYRNANGATEAAVLNWADGLLKAYPARKAIVTSHHIGNQSTGGPSPCSAGLGENFGTYGQAMWDALKDNPNLYMMLSGHCSGEAHFRMSGGSVPANEGGTDADRECMSDVHVIMSNYQFMGFNSGSDPVDTSAPNTGYLRLMRFDTVANTVAIETFSPWIETYPGSLPATGTNANTTTMSTNTASTYTIPYDTSISPSGVVLLPDTSGSMGWAVDGTPGVAANLQRIAYARQAASVFVNLMSTAPASPAVANLGLATFPDHPWTPGVGTADRIIDMTLYDAALQASMNAAILALSPEGGTPLLFGLEEANSMMSGMDCRAVVLLSDGKHNTPSPASVGDAATEAMLTTLGAGTADPTQVYAINFAGPGEGDIPLLQEIADRTDPNSTAGASSQFYDATATLANPGLGLTPIYEKILADVLNLSIGVDPIDFINFGETRSFFQGVNDHDRKVTFVISWQPGEAPLIAEVFDSSGNAIAPTEDGVTVITESSYLIFSVGGAALAASGRIGPNSWRVDVSHRPFQCPPTRVCVTDGIGNDDVIITDDDVGGGEGQLYQYSSIIDSGLKFNAWVDRETYRVGDTVRLFAEVAEGRRPILGLKQIEVLVEAPGDGLGNWFAENIVDPKSLSTIPTVQDGESLSPVFRKSLYLTRVAGIAHPARLSQRRIMLFDDGTNGDVAADDGVYSNTFSDTRKEGAYNFNFRVAGSTRYGYPFNREDFIQKHLQVRPVGEAILVDAVFVGSDQRPIYDFSVVPKDLFGNFVGPGRGSSVVLKPSTGQFIGSLIDNLDGSYSQNLLLDQGTSTKNVNIGLDILGVKKTVNLGQVLNGGEPEIRMCDLNGDDSVDITDIRAIAKRRGQPASGPDDPADWDKNGVINGLDVRGCMIACDLPRCAISR